jgi:hypothetical protein
MIIRQFAIARRILRTIGENSHKYLSDKFLGDLLVELIRELKYMEEKERKSTIDKKISELFTQVRRVKLKEFIFLIPIMHLNIHEEYEIGGTKFLVLNKDSLQNIGTKYGVDVLITEKTIEEQTKDLNDTNGTTAYALICINASDQEKAFEIAHQQTEFSLNIIRLFNKKSPIILLSEYSKEIPSWILMINPDSKSISHTMQTHNLDLPDDITIEKMNNMKKLGLVTVNDLVKLPSSDLTQFQDDILRAIFWFGNAVKDNYKVTKFLKCITVLETLLVSDQRDKSIPLAKKLASSLYANNNIEDKKQVFKSMIALYDLRSRITHNGLNTVLSEDVDSVMMFAQELIIELLKYSTTHNRIDDLFGTKFTIDDSLYEN